MSDTTLDSVSLENSPTSATLVEEPTSRFRRTLKTIGWSYLFVLCLIVFTILKLPEDRVRNYISGSISAALSAQGMTFTAAESHLSFGLGLSYIMKDVTLTFPPNGETAKLDRITVSPAILNLFMKRLGGTVAIDIGDGFIKATGWTKGKEFSGNFETKNLNLGKLGILPALAGFRAGGLATGNGNLHGDFSVPSTLVGNVKLDLSRIVIEEQSIQGFSIPRSTISESKIDLDIDKSKASIRTFRLGSPSINGSDDLQATITGDIVLGRQWESSTLNTDAKFRVSANILKSFILIDALLGAGKQADGSYHYNLTGPLMAPTYTPVSGGGKP